MRRARSPRSERDQPRLRRDEAAALDGLATLSVSSDGTTSETAASGDLRDDFNEAVKGHQK